MCIRDSVKVEDLDRMRDNLDFLGSDQPDEEAFDIF